MFLRSFVMCVCLLHLFISEAQSQSPDIDVNPTSHNYETIVVGEFSDHSFVVTNQGQTEQLVVLATEIQGANADQFRLINVSGGYVLNAGSTRSFTVRFEPTALGPQNAVIRIESNDPDENVINLAISGVGLGVPDISSPSSVQFGSVVIGAESNREIIVSNQGLAQLDITSISLSGTDAAMFSIIDGGSTGVLDVLEQKTIVVAFSPTSEGDKNARLQISSNDPNESVNEIALFGRGTSAEIAVDLTSHDYGEVVAGETARFAFLVSNKGLGDLIVDSLTINGTHADQFSVGTTTSFTVRAGEIRPLNVDFIPTVAGVLTAVLTLHSNDQATPQLNLILQGTTLVPSIMAITPTVEFGELIVGLDTSETVVLTNTGKAELNVTEYGITGGDSTQFSLDVAARAFTIRPMDSILVDVRFSPDSEGDKSSTLRFLSNDLNQPIFDTPLMGHAGTININADQEGIQGEDFVFTISVPEGFQPEEGELYYRSVGETLFRTVPLTDSSPDFRGVIPGVVMGLSGIEYYVRLSAGGRDVIYPDIDSQERPFFLPSRFVQVNVPLLPIARTFQMISVPGILDESDLADVLVDDYGPYNTQRWRLFRWKNNKYDEYPAMDERFDAGKSFWLITNEGAPFDIENGLSSDASQPFELTLEPGWNQIANPYTFPVAWPVQSVDPRIEAPVAYDGAEFVYGQTSLMPWIGYFVQNLASTQLTVLLDHREVAQGKKLKSTGEEFSYRLQLIAGVIGESLRDTQTFLGFAEGASEGPDAFDFSEAPPIGSFVRVSIIEPDGRKAGSFKPAGEQGQFWDLEIDGTFVNKSVQIDLSTKGNLPEGYELYVLDRDTRNAITVRDSSFIVDVSNNDSVRRLRILLGRREYADAYREDIPLESMAFKLVRNFPNPFKTETTIQYQIANRVPVRLSIFNLMGQRITTLVNTTLSAGSYSTTWDGRNDVGLTVGSGVYLYQLNAGEFTETQKMLFVR